MQGNRSGSGRRVRLADHAGFCSGVARAIEITRKAAREGPGSVVTLGPVVHNPDVVASLEAEGVRSSQSLDSLQPGVLVIPSHGTTPEVLEDARSRGFAIVDATCPHVARAQSAALRFSRQGRHVVIVGDEGHTEVKGIIGWAGGDAIVIRGPEEMDRIPPGRPLGVVAQTTQKPEVFEDVVQRLRSLGFDVEAQDTICHATRMRQEAARKLASEVDLMVVIGGAASANTKRLAEVCAETGVKVLRVERGKDLDIPSIAGASNIGVTAGASTPNWVIEEVLGTMTEIFENKAENPEVENVGEQSAETTSAPATSEPAVSGEAKSESVDRALHVPELRVNSIVKGTVVKVDDEQVLVDIGYKSEGVIPLKELSFRTVSNPSTLVKPGDVIEVVVKSLSDPETGGNPKLSKREADARRAWSRLEEAYKAGTIIEGPVVEAVKGGVVVDIGVRGFVPASQVGRRFIEDLSTLVGQTLRMKIIEMERGRNVVLSQRQVLEEEEAAAKARAFENLKEGSVVKGKVTRLTNFGAFVDIGGGVEGLLHVSDVTWGRLRHPGEVLSEGQEIEVKVLGVDRERERISLGLKQLTTDPWANIAEKYPIGSIHAGVVTKLMEFGAFVKLEDGVEGLVHISELANRRVNTPDEVVSVGQEVNVKVISLNEDTRRIGLSIRQTEERPREPREPRPRREREPRERRQKKETPETVGSGDFNVTLGDLVGDVLKNRDGK